MKTYKIGTKVLITLLILGMTFGLLPFAGLPGTGYVSADDEVRDYSADSYPLELVDGPLEVYVMNKGEAVIPLKLKNTSTKTVTAARWIDSSWIKVSDDPDDDWTPYHINDEAALEGHSVTGATFTTKEEYWGYDIEPGATATFWLHIDMKPLAAGTYEHYIQLGEVHEYLDFVYDPTDGSTTVWIRREVTAVYTPHIPITLHVYDPAVTASVGRFNSQNYTVTQQNTVDFGTVDLTTLTDNPQTGAAYYEFGLKNTTTATDPHTGEVPNIRFTHDVENLGVIRRYGTDAGFYASHAGSGATYQVGPGAATHFSVSFSYYRMVEGTYSGELILDTVPGNITVNDGQVPADAAAGTVTIPLQITLTGRNPNLPDPVTGLTATPGNGIVRLEWDDPEENVTCSIYRREGTETVTDWHDLDYTKYEFVGSISSRKGNTYVDTGLENGKTYSYFVITGTWAYAGPYTGYPSNVASAAPDGSMAIKLAAPTDVYATPYPGYVYLEWKLPEDDTIFQNGNGEGIIDHFNVYRNGKLVATVDQDAYWELYQDDYRWKIDIELEPFTHCQWTVSCVGMDGTEGFLSEPVESQAYPVIPEIVEYSAYWGEYEGYYLSIGFHTEPIENSADMALLSVWRDGEQVANHVAFGEGFEDTGVLPGHTYTYTAIGVTKEGFKTKPFTFTITTPPAGNGGHVIGTASWYLDYYIDDGTTPTFEFYDSTDYTIKAYRNGVAMQSYGIGNETKQIFRDTPEADGTYTYYLEYTDVLTGTVSRTQDYIFIKDSTPADPDDMMERPGAPSLTGVVSNRSMILSWTPSEDGGPTKGYYVYSMANGEYRTDCWLDSEGEQGEDFGEYPHDRLVRLNPDTYTFNDEYVPWEYDYQVPGEISWWVVAYNDVGVSEPSEIINKTGEYNEYYDMYMAPTNDSEEAPGTPEITGAEVVYEEVWEDYDKLDPSEHELRGEIMVTWKDGEGGQADWYTISDDDGTNYNTYTIFPGLGNEYPYDLYFPGYAGKTYTMGVKAENAAGVSGEDTAVVNIYGIPRMSLVDTAADQVEVRWTAPVEDGVTVSQYLIERRVARDPWETISTVRGSRRTRSDEVLSYVDTGLTPGTQYTYRVTAKCTDGIDRTSLEQTIAPRGLGVSLGAPTNLAAAIRDGNVWLSWTAPATGAVTSYEFQMKCQPGQEQYWPDDGWMTESTLVYSDLTSVMLETAHYLVGEQNMLRIRAVNDAGPGPWSEPCSFKVTEAQAAQTETDEPEPVDPVIEEGDGMLTLTWYRKPKGQYSDSWGDPVNRGEATYYRIEKAKISGDYEGTYFDIVADPSKSTTDPYVYVDTDVINGEVYRYYVYAYNSVGTIWSGYGVYAVYGIPNGLTDAQIAAQELDEIVVGLPDPADVTEDDREAIEAALEIYENMTDKEKNELDPETEEKLDALEQALEDLETQAQYAELIAAVQALIDALPDPEDVTLEDAAQIAEALEAYNALPDEAKPFVDTDKLMEDIEVINELRKEKEDQEAAQAVEDMIEALPDPDDVTEADAEAIQDAIDAYNALTDDQKDLVDEELKDKLEDLEEALLDLIPMDVAELTIQPVPDQTWTGSEIRPSLTVQRPKNGEMITLTENEDYTLAYANNIAVGQADIILTGRGKYTGTRTVHFNIIPEVVEPELERIAGSNRFVTATEAAEWLKKNVPVEKFSNVVIASGMAFPDALAGAYLAVVKDAPVLLTNAGFAPTVAEYVKQNMAAGGTVYILGGRGAVPDVMETELAARGITSVERLKGKNRYDTNIEILKEAGVNGEDLLVCSGNGYADSLSASAVGKPILLVGAGLSDAQKAYLESVKDEISGNCYAIGGAGAVSEEAFGQVKAYATGTAERVSGKNRFLTSVAVAEKFFPAELNTVVLAYAMNYPDGLAGGPVAYSTGSPLLLITDTIYGDAKTYAGQTGAKRVIVMGGKSLISDETALGMIQ